MSETKMEIEKYKFLEVGNAYVRNGNKYFTRNRYIDYREINNFLKATNYFGSFCSAFRYCSDSDIEHSLIYGDLYFDFDCENNFENVRMDAKTVITYLETVFGITEKEYSLYYSGNKGIHIVVPGEVLGIQPCENLNDIFRYIVINAKGFTPNKTIDTQIYDKKRLFRIPNTIHEKSNLFKIPITKQELFSLSLQEIKVLASQPRILAKSIRKTVPEAKRKFERYIQDFVIAQKQEENSRNSTRRNTINFVPPCVQYMLDNGADVGLRNITIACLASFYKSSGESLNNTVELISDWNLNNSNPSPQAELKRTVQSIYTSNKTYGCNKLSEISQCSESCRIYKNKHKQNASQEDIDRKNKLKELGIL